MPLNEKIEEILPLVQRPARYIDHELNSCHADKPGAVSVCLCFPDLYEVGASNLGLEILYHVLNRRDDAVAERCYTPAADMEGHLRNNALPLFSLESGRPVRDHDIVGFSLQYELCSTNILNMLDLAGIPLRAADRDDTVPLIAGGGPMTANPEPLSDFFDLFVLGDGEEALGEIVAAVKAAKAAGKNGRESLLGELAKIEGVYVPSFYDVAYNDDGTVASVRPNRPGVPETVRKRTVSLEDVPFPAAKIVPYLQTVHDRLNIEVARGCPGKCRFCQAQKYYWPWRVRSKDRLLQLAEEGLSSTGYEEISYSSLSCTEYRDLEQLLDETNARYGSRRISISLPSLRCDRFSLKVAGNLGYAKRASLTFAPEAGTDRLRYVIGKNLPETQIRETLVTAWRMGWKLIKLYFMVGLPTETDEDIDGINTLVRSIRKEAHGLNFNVTVSPFVPKAQTPFQWVPMERPEVMQARLDRLSRRLPASVKGHLMPLSILEGVLARGDRRLGAAVLRAWEKGCRFDQWKEHLRYDLWEESFRETGVDAGFYLYRERGSGEVLPWDHLLFASGKEAFRADYERGLAVEPEAGTPAEGALPVPATNLPPAPRTVQRLRLRFARRGPVRFLSHLEQIEVFRRALRRSGLPLAYTAGFSPQVKVAFGPAVSVGYESESEYIEVDLAGREDSGAVEARLSRALPEGFSLLGVRKIPLFFPSLDSLLNVAEYRIGVGATQEQVDRLLARTEIVVEKVKKKGVERIDARPLIRELRVDGDGLFLQMRFGPKRNVKPERVVQELCGMTEEQAKLLRINRTALYIEKADGTLTRP